jgi:hypothetical protein
MGDKVIITETEDKPRPDTIVVVPKEMAETTEKEVVVTETTKIKTKQD